MYKIFSLDQMKFSFRAIDCRSSSSMTQWPIQRHVYTLVPPNHSMNRSNEPTQNTTTTPLRILTPTIFDDSLTNLSWLHDMNILKRTIPTINSSSSTTNSGNQSISNKRKDQSLSNTSITSSSSSSLGAVYPNDIDDNTDLIINNDEDDEQWKLYKTNPQAKPVYSYSQLILLAMRQSGYEKMTLQMIYEWVAEHFPYFKKMEPTWQVMTVFKHSKHIIDLFFRILFDTIYR